MMWSIRNEARLKRPVNLDKPKLATLSGLCNSPSGGCLEPSMDPCHAEPELVMRNCALGSMSGAFEPEDARESVLRNADILRLLFQDLDLEDLLRAASTCRTWFRVSQSPEFWANLDFSGRKVRARQVGHSLRHVGPRLHLRGMKGRRGSQSPQHAWKKDTWPDRAVSRHTAQDETENSLSKNRPVLNGCDRAVCHIL